LALPPQSGDAFLREVDDAVRHDELLSLWQRYGRVAIGIILASLIGFAAYLGWEHYRASASGEVAEKADAMLKSANGGPEQAKLIAELEQAGQPGYRAIALLTKAANAVQKGDLKGASGQYAALAKDEDLAQPYRDLALVRQVALSFDQMAPQQVIDTLKPLAIEGEPWYGSAGEMTAIAYMKMGKRDLAGTTFAAIAKDAGVPTSIRARARQMAGLLGLDATDDAPGAAQGEAN